MWKRVLQLVPVAQLSDAAFAVRHRVLRLVLWLHVPVLTGVALLTRESSTHAGHAGLATGHSGVHASLIWLMIAAVAVCAALASRVRTRRGGAVTVSTGLMLAAAALVHAGGGLTDLHFHFFVVLGLISLYQDWLPFVLSVALVAAHHVLTGIVTPELLYSDPRAAQYPVRWAVMHAAFVLAMCAVQVAYWRFARDAQQETDQVRAEAERALRQSEERHRALVQDSCDVIAVIGVDGTVTSVSPAVEPVTGHRAEDVVGTEYRALVHPDDLDGILAVTPGSGAQNRAEVRLRYADGTWHWHDVTLRDLSDHPAIEGIVAHHRDISDRRAFQERLAHEASHDSLTELVNRPAFLRGTQEVLAATSHEGQRAAILFLDLKGFKPINDTYGHEAGDLALAAVAEKLRRCVLGSDIVGRLGGDEFAVTLTNISTAENAIVVAQRILSELALPCSIMDQTIVVGGSIGIAVSDPDVGIDELLRRADTAMYRAKRDRTPGWMLYVDGMHGHDVRANALEDDLSRAVEAGQLRLRYQPIVGMEDGRLLELEALVRWQHPRRGLLAPADFLPLAEQVGLIGGIGDWVLETACREVTRWQARMPEGRRLGLSVNISPHQLTDRSFAWSVASILQRTGFDPHDLTLELSEGALGDDPRAVEQLTTLNDRGVRIALDDFGSGNSSLEHLSELPVDVLKLDRRYVSRLDGTPHGSAVAQAVIRLGAILHLDIVAKGIETPAQADELSLLGCPTGQGYHICGPLDPEAIDLLLDRPGTMMVRS
jgi:diguanylate cyclase (GGDEF)-like protein/PAS domain S-box-containing protein